MKILRMKNNTVANLEERINERMKRPSPRLVTPATSGLNSPSGSNTNILSFRGTAGTHTGISQRAGTASNGLRISRTTLNSPTSSPGKLNRAIDKLTKGACDEFGEILKYKPSQYTKLVDSFKNKIHMDA